MKEFLAILEESITEEQIIDDEVSDTGEVIAEEKETENDEEEQKKEKKEKPIVQVIGYVDTVRKIQTKKGDNMLIATCSST